MKKNKAICKRIDFLNEILCSVFGDEQRFNSHCHIIQSCIFGVWPRLCIHFINRTFVIVCVHICVRTYAIFFLLLQFSRAYRFKMVWRFITGLSMNLNVLIGNFIRLYALLPFMCFALETFILFFSFEHENRMKTKNWFMRLQRMDGPDFKNKWQKKTYAHKTQLKV